MNDKEFDRMLAATRERWRPYNEWKGRIDERILRLEVSHQGGAGEGGLPQGARRDASLSGSRRRQESWGGDAHHA